MKNILTDHPSQEVRIATVRLLDALCSWERTTGRQNILIIKDTIGCGYRSFSGAPQPADIPDAHLLEAFDSIYKEHNPQMTEPTKKGEKR